MVVEFAFVSEIAACPAHRRLPWAKPEQAHYLPVGREEEANAHPGAHLDCRRFPSPRIERSHAALCIALA